MGATTNADIGHIEGLGVNLPIHRIRKKLSEGGTVDVGSGKNGFVLIPSIPSLVVMVGC